MSVCTLSVIEKHVNMKYVQQETSHINVAIKEEVDFTEEDMDENCMVC